MEATKPKTEALDLFLMANLRPKTTGLPMTIWVSERGNARHGPRLKVSLQHGPKMDPYHTASVTLGDDPREIDGTLTPEDLRLVKSFIQLNRAALEAYWKGGIDTGELLERLKALGRA